MKTKTLMTLTAFLLIMPIAYSFSVSSSSFEINGTIVSGGTNLSSNNFEIEGLAIGSPTGGNVSGSNFELMLIPTYLVCSEPDYCVFQDDCYFADVLDNFTYNADSCQYYKGYCGREYDSSYWYDSSYSDYSKDVCICTSSGNWDNTYGCCDSGDYWETDEWLCIDGTSTKCTPKEFCNVIEINGEKKWCDSTAWVSKAPIGCSCEGSYECESGICSPEGFCYEEDAPSISFGNIIITTELNNDAELIIKVKNNMAVKEKLKLQLLGAEPIKHWTYFYGKEKQPDRNDLTIEIEPGREKAVNAGVKAYKVGSYKVTIFGESSVTGLKGRDEANIRITYKERGFFARSPGMEWAYFMVIILTGMLAAKRRNY